MGYKDSGSEVAARVGGECDEPCQTRLFSIAVHDQSLLSQNDKPAIHSEERMDSLSIQRFVLARAILLPHDLERPHIVQPCIPLVQSPMDNDFAPPPRGGEPSPRLRLLPAVDVLEFRPAEPAGWGIEERPGVRVELLTKISDRL